MARMEERRGTHRTLVGKTERDHLGDQDVEDRIILKQALKNSIYWAWTGLI